MLTRKVANVAVIFSVVAMAVITFVIQWPCRNSGYTDGRYTSMCYSDFAAMFANPPLAEGAWPFGATNGINLSPLSSMIAWAISLTPFDFVTHVILMQLVLVAAMMVTVVMIMKLRHWRPLDAAMAALIPVWPFVWFISDDMVSVMFASISLWLWHRDKTLLSALALGVGAASGAWVLVLLVAYWVFEYRQENVRNWFSVAAIALAVPIVLSLPRVLAGQSILQSGDQTAGEGSILYIWSIVTDSKPGSNMIITLFGFTLIALVARWAINLPFDFRLEPLVAVLVVIQLLSSPTIAPQALTHFLWLIVLVMPRKSFVLGFSIVPIIYVASIWLRFEAGTPNGKGISIELYALICIGLWICLIEFARRSMRLLTVQGIDDVMQSLGESMSRKPDLSRIIKAN